jgi:hypothetical protein
VHIRRTDKIGREARFHAVRCARVLRVRVCCTRVRVIAVCLCTQSREYTDRVVRHALLHAPQLKVCARACAHITVACMVQQLNVFVVTDEANIDVELKAIVSVSLWPHIRLRTSHSQRNTPITSRQYDLSTIECVEACRALH